MSLSKPANRVQKAYLGLGGNLGDRRAHLTDALARLAATPEVRLARLSPVYETKAVGPGDQPDFLNLVVELETTLAPHALLDVCLATEQHLGRIRRERWGPRSIDLDVLLFGNEIIRDERLTVPHPRLHERAFVLAPLADLSPDLAVHGEPIRTHLTRADRSGIAARPDLALDTPVLLEEVTLPAPPHEFFAALADRDHAFFLDSGLSSGGLGAYSFIGFDPFLILSAKDGRITVTRDGRTETHPGDPLAELQSILRRYRRPNPVCHLGRVSEIDQVGVRGKTGSAKAAEAEATQRVVPPRTTPAQPAFPLTRRVRRPEVFQKHALIGDKSSAASAAPVLPFTGGAVGFFGYELCTQLEKLPRNRPDDLPAIPDCEFAFYDAIIAHEHATARTWLVANPVATTPAAALLDRLRSTLCPPPPPPAAAPPTAQTTPTPNPVCHLIGDKPGLVPAAAPLPPAANFDFPTYAAAIARIKAYIASGDVYQVNLTQRFETALPCEPYALYQRLRARSPAPFASYFSFRPVQIVSSSPERFLTFHGRRVETRPIKGTRPRSSDPVVDARLAAELLASEKDRAELLMIVDLERNDLGRVCEFGSIQVEKLWQLESHPTVHHLVATVSGTLRPDVDVVDCLRASFPGGSITGAPKIRSMEIIDELEPHRRHIYTGAIGYIGFDGNADLNIAIRTITCVNGRAFYHVGGGIVWDSDPAAEYQETLDKGRAMHSALTGA